MRGLHSFKEAHRAVEKSLTTKIKSRNSECPFATTFDLRQQLETLQSSMYSEIGQFAQIQRMSCRILSCFCREKFQNYVAEKCEDHRPEAREAQFEYNQGSECLVYSGTQLLTSQPKSYIWWRRFTSCIILLRSLSKIMFCFDFVLSGHVISCVARTT